MSRGVDLALAVQSGRMDDRCPDKALFGGLILMGVVAFVVVLAVALLAVVGLRA